MRLTLIILIVLAAQYTNAQDPIVVKYAETITAGELKEHLSIIASDKYEGRYTSEKGQQMAAEYLINDFKKNNVVGIVPNVENPYYQDMELEKRIWTKREIQVGKEVFISHKDISFLQAPVGEEEYDVIFAGYGIYSKNYNDYKNIDVKGKIVAFIMGEPLGKDSIYLVTASKEPSLPPDTNIQSKFASIQGKIMASMMRGAKGFIIIEKDDKEGQRAIDKMRQFIGDVEVNFPGKGPGPMQSFPVLYISPSQAARMFGVKPKEFTKTVEGLIDTANSTSGKYIQKIKLITEQKVEKVKSSNILGYIEGSDKKNEIVVISAHYDHEGVKNGEVYNGADDNGSGTVSLLELSEAFAQAKKDGHGPRRSILFLALTGEERGLLGSDYYAKHPVFAMDSTVVDLNVDMVGRIDKPHENHPDYIYLIGVDYLSSELDEISKNTAKTYFPDMILDYTYNAKDHPEQLYYRSDQIKFAEKGVPVIFYTSGEHDDYHTPADDVDKINFEALQNRIRLVFATAWELANRDERIKVDKEKE